jgi:DNA-binding winged helix-turn-helix (wHTH) protein/tetratricopeptide (TPR) repeat protein
VIIAFGEFELDVGTYKLRRAGVDVPLQPKIFDAIRYLVERAGRVVRKQELLDALWLGEHVNETAVPWTINRARKALGQGHKDKHPIETVRGRGYRFSGEVREVRTSSTSLVPPAPSSRALPSLPSLPALASQQAPVSRRPPPGDPFVGRAEAMNQLLDLLYGARAGRGRLCLVSGEAGIGKTRVMSELAQVAQAEGQTPWSGRCVEEGRAAAFWPWVQVLRDAAVDPSVSASLQAEMRGLLVELIPNPQSRDRFVDMTASSAVAARFWVLEKLSRHLLACAETGPRIVMIDDAHLADEASLDLLAFLAPEVSRAAMLIVVTARNALAAGSDAWAKSLGRLSPMDRIELPVLKPADVESYVSAVTGVELPEDIRSTVYLKCGGNPLFLQETVRVVSAFCDREGVESLRKEDIAVPGVAREVWRARLAGLTPSACEALEVACVIGQEFELPVLQRALGVAPELLLVHLDEASRARLVFARSRAGVYAFAHDTIREALYDDLSRARRVDLHFRVAQALEARALGELQVHELAYHFYRALPRSAPDQVERYACLAADAAIRGYAYEDASQLYGWALEAQRFRADVSARGRCELLLSYATALRLSGRLPDSRRAVEQAVDVARQHAFPDLLCEAARRLRPSVNSAVVPDALALRALEEAQRLITDDQTSLRIRVLGRLACVPPYSLSTERSQELSARAVDLARQSGDKDDLTEALRYRLPALSGPDHIDELLEVTSEILRLKPDVGSNAGEVEAARYHALLQRGEMAAARRELEALGRLGRELRRPEMQWHYDRLRAQELFHAGDFPAADAAFRDLFDRSRRMRLPYGELFFTMQFMALASERTGLSMLSASGREWASKLEWASPIPSFRAHEARFFVEIGRLDEARETFEAIARGGFDAFTKDLSYLNALAHLAVVAVALEDRPRGERLYSLLKPYPRHNTPSALGFYLGSASYFLGLLARLLGRGEQAARHLEDALADNERMGYAAMAARTQLSLAEVLAEEGSRAARLRASALLADAGATARRLEMAPLTSAIERLRGKVTLPRGRARAV